VLKDLMVSTSGICSATLHQPFQRNLYSRAEIRRAANRSRHHHERKRDHPARDPGAQRPPSSPRAGSPTAAWNPRRRPEATSPFPSAKARSRQDRSSSPAPCGSISLTLASNRPPRTPKYRRKRVFRGRSGRPHGMSACTAGLPVGADRSGDMARAGWPVVTRY